MNRFVIIVFSLSVFCTHAQPCSSVLKGRVVDFHDGTALEEATITLTKNNNTTTTNAEGAFVFPHLCDGFYELEISHPECRTVIMLVKVEGETHKKISLEHHLEALGEVVVADSKVPKYSISSIENSIKTDVIEQNNTASLGDVLKKISGVSSLNTGNAIVKPIIHGMHSSRVPVINNNVQLEDQEWGVEHAPNVDINSAARISVIKGASALRYGGSAIGGTVIISPEKLPVNDTLYGKTIITTASNGRGAGISSAITKAHESGWHWKVQGTLKRFGDLEAPHYVLSNTGVLEQDMSIAFGKNTFTSGFSAYYSYYHTEIGILRTSHIGSIEDLIRAINSNIPLRIEDFTYNINPPKQEITHHLAKLSYFKRFENLGKLSLQYAFQQNNRFEFDIRRGDDKAKPSVDLRLNTHSVEAHFEMDAKSDYKITSGIQMQYQNNFPNPETGVRRLIPDYDKYDMGAFINGSYYIADDFVAEAGIRYDYSHINAKKFYLKSRWEERNYDNDFSAIITGDFATQWLTNPIFNFHNIAAVGGFRYDVLPSLQLLLNYSMANRNPNPTELFSDGLHHSAAIIELGDLRFGKETAHKIMASVQGNFKNIKFEASPYLNTVNNFIRLQPSGVELTIRGAFPVWEYTQTHARLFGVDLNATVAMGAAFHLENRFSYVYGQDLTNDIPLIDMPPANWNTVLSFKNEDFYNFHVALESDVVFQQKRFPDTNFTVTTLQTGVPLEVLVDLSTPPQGYQLFHLHAEMAFKLSKKLRMKLSGTLQNMLNTSYRNYLNRLRYYADETGRNFLFSIKFNY